MIIGASGYIGAALFRELATVYEVIGTYNTVQFFPELIHLDVTSQESVRNTITSVNPDVIIHTAADSSISYCESNPDQALLVNTKGTQNIVEFANTTDARIIYLSSLGAVDPITQYGKTKLLGEEYVKQTKKGFDILRLSMVFGVSPNLSDDSPFGKIVRTLKTGHPLCYDDTWKFPPTYLPNVSFILRVMLKEHSKNSLTTVAIPELKSMYEIARDILKPFGREVKPKYAHKIGRRLEVVPKSDEFELPVCTYADMVNALINDLKKSKIGSRF